MAKISFLDKCLAYLKTDDKSVVTKVLVRATKECNNNIRNAEQAIANIEFTTKNTVEKLQDKLEDAKTALKESYMTINVDSCKTSDAIESFIDSSYLPNISNKIANVKSLEKQIEDAGKIKDDEIKAMNDAADMYKDLLNVLSTDVEA